MKTTANVPGYDHGFLSGWFLVLTYIVIIWANLTALALIGRNLLGDLFQFGFHYQLAGYDIYFGEILVSIGVLFLCGLFCLFRKRLAMWVQIVMALVLIGGIICDVFSHSPVYRTGGDEFVVILRGRDYDSREERIEKIHESNRKNLAGNGAVIAVGMSVYAPESDRSLDAIFIRADAAMYENKKMLKKAVCQ